MHVRTLVGLAIASTIGLVLLVAAPYYEQFDGHHDRSAHLLVVLVLFASAVVLHASASTGPPGILFLVAALIGAAIVYPTTLVIALFITAIEASIATAGALLLYMTLAAYVRLLGGGGA